MGKFYSNITGKSYTSESMRATDEHKYLHNEKLRIERELRHQKERDWKLQKENTERIINGGLTNQEIFELELYNVLVQRFGKKKVDSIAKYCLFVLVAGFMVFLLTGGSTDSEMAVLFLGFLLLIARWAFDIKEKSKLVARIIFFVALALIVFAIFAIWII